MVMRLLSTPQGKSARELETAQQALRITQLDETMRAKRKELNDLDKQLENDLSEKGLRNYQEEQLWKAKLAGLAREVEALESRRKSALVPLEEREKAVQDRESVLLQREESVVLRESDVEYAKDSLEERIDSVSEREQGANDNDKRLSIREANIRLQEQETAKRADALARIMNESYVETESAKTDLARQKAVIKGRDTAISERERIVAEKEAGFADRERAIADRYKTLQRAIMETNLKNDGKLGTKRPE